MFDYSVPAPFDTAFNQAVLHISGVLVPEYIVSDDAPGTYNQLKELLDSGRTLIVASAGSERTIFGCAEVNIAFRAWHDWCHWYGGFDFSLYGECATCNLQIEHLKVFFGVNSNTSRWTQYLIAEVIGQRQYYERYREYITDQRAFISAYLNNPATALSRRW